VRGVAVTPVEQLATWIADLPYRGALGHTHVVFGVGGHYSSCEVVGIDVAYKKANELLEQGAKHVAIFKLGAKRSRASTRLVREWRSES
jgi:hypothetical protein